MMDLKKLDLIVEKITKSDAGFLLGGFLGGILYLVLYFSYPVVFPLELPILIFVAFLGALLGLGFQKIIESIYNYLSASIKSISNYLIASAKYIFNSLFNRKPDRLKDFEIEERIFKKKLYNLWQGVEMGLSPLKAEEYREKLYEEYLFETISNQERLPFNSENEEKYLLPNDTIDNEDEEQDSPPNDSL